MGAVSFTVYVTVHYLPGYMLFFSVFQFTLIEVKHYGLPDIVLTQSGSLLSD